MTTTQIKIVFTANLKDGVEIASQKISLGGAYPPIEVENLKDRKFTHLFKITKNVPHMGQQMIESVAKEAQREIEEFWNIFAFLRTCTVLPHASVQYEYKNELNDVRPRASRGVAHMTASVGPAYFKSNATLFNKKYDYDLLKRFNFARSLQDPVSRFLSLYSLVSSLASDDQAKIDRLIVSIEKTVGKSKSPKNGKPETIFTRLRNELAHHRAGVSVFDTHDEISQQVDRFAWIVGRLLAPRINM